MFSFFVPMLYKCCLLVPHMVAWCLWTNEISIHWYQTSVQHGELWYMYMYMGGFHIDSTENLPPVPPPLPARKSHCCCCVNLPLTVTILSLLALSRRRRSRGSKSKHSSSKSKSSHSKSKSKIYGGYAQTCQDTRNNPCTRTNFKKQYLPHVDKKKFVQCDADFQHFKQW